VRTHRPAWPKPSRPKPRKRSMWTFDVSCQKRLWPRPGVPTSAGWQAGRCRELVDAGGRESRAACRAWAGRGGRSCSNRRIWGVWADRADRRSGAFWAVRMALVSRRPLRSLLESGLESRMNRHACPAVSVPGARQAPALWLRRFRRRALHGRFDSSGMAATQRLLSVAAAQLTTAWEQPFRTRTSNDDLL
jgi:hypothetical protein